MSSTTEIYKYIADMRNGIPRPTRLPETTVYLTPDADTSGHETMVREIPTWVPPAPSTASRMPPARSRGYCRGFIVDARTNQAYVFESALESDALCIMLADRRISVVQDHPPAVSYVGPDGRDRRHIFDYLAVTVDGTRIAFAVKPSARVEKSRIQETLDLIEDQVGAQFADHYRVLTENLITKPKAHTARMILRARRARNQGDVDTVRLAVPPTGTFTIGELLAVTALGARGWNAVLNLIDEGGLTVIQPGGTSRLNEGSLVRASASNSMK